MDNDSNFDNTFNNNYKQGKGGSIFRYVSSFLEQTAVSQSLPIRYLKHIVFILILGLLYVANTHCHQKIVHDISILKNRLTDLSVSYITLNATYMHSIRESEISKKAKDIGLQASDVTPFILIPNK